MNPTLNAFLFDIDGVLTNEKLEVNQELIQKISDLVKRGSKVGFLTGRPSTWLLENILYPIQKSLPEKTSKNIYAAAEFGAVTLENENGHQKFVLNQNMVLPKTITEEARKIFEEYKNSMWIEEKQSMFTVVSNTGNPSSTFHEDQKKLVVKFEDLLKKDNIDSEFEVQPDFIATNIRSKKANKKDATANFLSWLKSVNFKPNIVYVFGDSPSDYEMAEDLKDQNIDYKFIFVRDATSLNEKQDKNIVFTKKSFDAGTLEFLESLN